MEVSANMHMYEHNNVVAIGEITINKNMVVKNVRVLSKKDEDGKEKYFVSMPGYATSDGTWKSIVSATNKTDKEDIQAAVIESLKNDLSKDISLPEVEARVTLYEKNNIVGLASIKVSGLSIDSIQICKSSQGNIYVKMPQYKVEKDGTTKWNDIVYPNSAAMRHKISQVIIDTYQEKIKERNNIPPSLEQANIKADKINEKDPPAENKSKKKSRERSK